MIELPEAVTLGRQAHQTLVGRRVTEVYGPTQVHKFTFFNAPPETFRSMLVGRAVESAFGRGAYVEVCFEGGWRLSVSDGIVVRYGAPGDPVPPKFQLLVAFDDESFVWLNTRMYGNISVFDTPPDNKYRRASLEGTLPLDEQFDEAFFDRLIASETKNISVKALLATEQRVPGLGNGVLQDILFRAELNPKRKIFSLTDKETEGLFRSVKTTLEEMTDAGGRDTESDLFGHKGGYRTILSQYTYADPCPRCGGAIKKENYLGGSVYYCTTCQK